MFTHQARQSTFLAGAAVVGLALAIGCESRPKGRIEIDQTLKSEQSARRILPSALYEFSDQVPQALAQKLADIPQVRDADDRATIIVGDIYNKTGIVSNNEFELVRSRIRNSLLQSAYMRNRLRFVENRARMARIADRELVGESADEAGPPNYDPKTAFAINMDVYRIERGKANYYYLEYQLVHFKSNEIVFSDRIDTKQARERYSD